MRSNVCLVVMSVALLALSARAGFAKCDPTGADAVDVATARAAIDNPVTGCDCAGATNHGQYVKCAAKSTCGKPGFVTCCRTKANGSTKCSTKSSADRCKDPKGGSSCVGTFASCCDACTATGCAGGGSPSGAFIDPIR